MKTYKHEYSNQPEIHIGCHSRTVLLFCIRTKPSSYHTDNDRPTASRCHRCMGNDAVISPNLDALAAEGTLFMNGYSSCPSSTPARAGLLTGLSPWHHGLLGYGKVSPEYKYEMPQMLKDAGYYTLESGKCTGIPNG